MKPDRQQIMHNLTAAVSQYLERLAHEHRHTIVAWATRNGRVYVSHEFPNWRRGFNGLTGVTSCCKDSPVGTVVNRLFLDLLES